MPAFAGMTLNMFICEFLHVFVGENDLFRGSTNLPATRIYGITTVDRSPLITPFNGPATYAIMPLEASL